LTERMEFYGVWADSNKLAPLIRTAYSKFAIRFAKTS